MIDDIHHLTYFTSFHECTLIINPTSGSQLMKGTGKPFELGAKETSDGWAASVGCTSEPSTPGDIHHEHVSPTPVKFKSSFLYHMCPPNIIKTASGVKHVETMRPNGSTKNPSERTRLGTFWGINYLLQRCLVVIFHWFSKVGKMCGKHFFVFVKTPCLKT